MSIFTDALDSGFSANGGNNLTYFFSNDYSAWNVHEIAQFEDALSQWENVANITFTPAASQASAEFVFYNTSEAEIRAVLNVPANAGAPLGAFELPNGSLAQQESWFNYESTGWDYSNTTGGLGQGGYGYITILHEVGHGLGLNHPHDGSPLFPGITGSSDAFSTGTNGYNQGINTVMSYNDGLVANGLNPSTTQGYGWTGTPMAFDIAAIQSMYGANNNYQTGDDTYVLPSSNANGTFYSSIWDAGGTDTIVAQGNTGAVINLNAASLVNGDVDAGGAVSATNGIYGGFTIANGAVIENATGGGGNDTITGNGVANSLFGGAGNDVMHGGNNVDRLFGQTGADQLYGDGGEDLLYFDADDTVVDGGASFDKGIVYGSVMLNTVGLTGIEQVIGHNGGDDQINGTGITDRLSILGLDGNDTLTGGSSHDSLFGGNGNDTLNGGVGIDYLIGGSGNDILNGDADIDKLFGQDGNDSLLGGAGNDWLYFDAYDTVVDGGGNFDRAVIVGAAPINLADVGLTNVEVVYGVHSGNDFIDGSGILDVLQIQGQGGNDTIIGGSNNDILRGDSGDDTINGGLGIDSLHGGTGNDIIHGNENIDLVYGYAGADELYGDAGNDYLYFDANDTVVDGGADFDRAYIIGSDAVGGMNLFSVGMINVELVYGHDGYSDILDGSDLTQDIMLSGQAGDDVLGGGAGNDVLIGGLNNDTFAFSGIGQFGNDIITDFANNGLELIDFSGHTGVNAFSDITIDYSSGEAVLSTDFGQITLTGVTDSIDATDFTF